jgi:hypothetical protein
LVELAFAAAGADAAGVLPVGGRLEIGIPEGPSSALAGPGVVNGAAAGLAIEENAVAVRELLEALSNADLPAVFVFEFIDAEADEDRERSDFFVRDPNVARSATAAIAALGAGEVEAGVVPRQIGHVSRSKFQVTSWDDALFITRNVKLGT